MVNAGAFGPDVAVFEESQKSSDGRRWWSGLPGIVADLESEWGIDTGRPFGGGSALMGRSSADGDWRASAVLKVKVPHREARGEASALSLWNGSGAVRLYRYDAERWALLVERCEPGTPLLAAGLEPEQSLSMTAGARVDGQAPTAARSRRNGAKGGAFSTGATECTLALRLRVVHPLFVGGDDGGRLRMGAHQGLVMRLPLRTTCGTSGSMSDAGARSGKWTGARPPDSQSP